MWNYVTWREQVPLPIEGLSNQWKNKREHYYNVWDIVACHWSCVCAPLITGEILALERNREADVNIMFISLILFTLKKLWDQVWNMFHSQTNNNIKARNSDTLGSVELIVQPEQGDQGDQGDWREQDD